MPKNKSLCDAKDRTDNQCSKYKLNDSNYCKLHDYYNNYTEDEKQNVKICSGCKKQKYS